MRMIGSAFCSTLKDALERRCLWTIEGILSTLIYRLGVNIAIRVQVERLVVAGLRRRMACMKVLTTYKNKIDGQRSTKWSC